MKFHNALGFLLSGEATHIRRERWAADVYVQITSETMKDTRTILPPLARPFTKYLYIQGDHGKIPWMPDQIEMLTDDDWHCRFIKEVVNLG